MTAINEAMFEPKVARHLREAVDCDCVVCDATAAFENLLRSLHRVYAGLLCEEDLCRITEFKPVRLLVDSQALVLHDINKFYLGEKGIPFTDVDSQAEDLENERGRHDES